MCVLLPAADFYLRMAYPPARKLLDSGAGVALATDFNPGSSPTQDLSFVGVLARLEMQMHLPEVIAAYTQGAAQALGLGHQVGTLEAGKDCDFIELQDDWDRLFYEVGYHPVARTWSRGRPIG
jgi:imidazolonepropionase